MLLFSLSVFLTLAWFTSLGVSPPGGVKSRLDWPQALARFRSSSFGRPSKTPKLCIWKRSQQQGERGEQGGPHFRPEDEDERNLTLSLSRGSETISVAEEWGLFLRMISAVWPGKHDIHNTHHLKANHFDAATFSQRIEPVSHWLVCFC